MPIHNVKFEGDVQVWHPETSNIYGCRIGAGTKVGALVEIQRGVIIGRNCTISSLSFICDGVTIEDNVFIGHGVKFINERHPKSGRGDWTLPPENVILVKRGAVIGTGAIVMPGVTIGKNAEVGAGTLVLRDVPDHAVVITGSRQIILYYTDCNPTWRSWPEERGECDVESS